VVVGEFCQRPGVAGRDQGPVGPVDARLPHRLPDDEEVRERLRGRPRARDDVDRGLRKRERVEGRRRLGRVDVVQDVVVGPAGSERGRDGGRAQRAPADAHRQDRLAVGERCDRRLDVGGVRSFGKGQRRVPELVVGHTRRDAVVCPRDPVVQPVKGVRADPGIGHRRQRVADVESHTRGVGGWGVRSGVTAWTYRAVFPRTGPTPGDERGRHSR
jgi:hypothetical protein